MKFLVKQFDIDTERKVFSQEASTLGIPPWTTLPPTITLVSDMGCEGDFSGMQVGRDGTPDSDITHWEYFPTAVKVKEHPRLEGWKVIIFND